MGPVSGKHGDQYRRDEALVAELRATEAFGVELKPIGAVLAGAEEAVERLHRTWDAGLQGRFVGQAFDDDLNTFPLARFFTMDGEISRQVLPHARLFVAIQNLTNARYATAATPVLSLGPPLLVRGGFRIDVR